MFFVQFFFSTNLQLLFRWRARWKDGKRGRIGREGERILGQAVKGFYGLSRSGTFTSSLRILLESQMPLLPFFPHFFFPSFAVFLLPFFFWDLFILFYFSCLTHGASGFVSRGELNEIHMCFSFFYWDLSRVLITPSIITTVYQKRSVLRVNVIGTRRYFFFMRLKVGLWSL